MAKKQVDATPEQRIARLERTVSDLSRALREQKQAVQLLEAIRKAQSLLITDADPEKIFPLLLQTLIDITDSEYGFLDEVVVDAAGRISKKNLALSNIAWDDASRRLYRQLQDRGMRFTFLENLAGLPALSGQAVIANDPFHDPRSGGIPDGHPSIHSYMGLPLFFGGQLIGVAGVANRREGYTMEIARFLEPLLSTCAGITYALRKESAEKDHIDRLKRNRNQLQAFLDAIPESAFLMQTDGTVLALNRTTAERLNTRPQEILGKSIYDLIPADAGQRRKEFVDKAIAAGQCVRFEDERDGRTLYHSVSPVKEGSGSVTRLAVVGMDISEVIEVKRRLKEREAQYRTIVETANEGIWVMDRDYRTTYANTVMLEMLGCRSPEEMLGRQVTDFMFPDQLPDHQEMMNRRQQGHSDVYERCFRKKDGSELWTIVSARSRFDENGQFDGSFAMFTDITEKHHALRQLEKLVHDQSAILDNISAYIYFKDTRNNIIRISESVARVTGLNKSDIEGRHSSEIYPETADRYWADDLEVINTGKPKLGIIEPLPAAGGDERWLLTDKVPYFDGSGRVAGVIVLASDITEKVLAEKRLEASEVKFRSLFENAADAVYLVFTDGRLLDANAAAQRQTGYSREALLQMRVEDLDPKEEPKKDQETLWPSLHPGESAVISRRHRRRDGSFFPVEINLSAMELSGETVIIAFCRDVTATAEMQKQLRQAQKMESIGNLAGGIAHDFNNLLYPMIGMAEMLMEDLPPNSLEYDNAAEIYSAGIRAADLVRQILAFSRKTEIQKQPIRLQTVVNKALKLVRATIPNDIGIHPVIQADCGEVMADPTQMQQVAINLLTNAYHAVMETSGEITVRLREVSLKTDRTRSLSLSPGSYALLSVIDNGHGIEPSLTEKIFDPYFTTKAPGGGTGLGLAVVYGIVKDHGGGVHVDSENGKGTTFDVYLPVTAPQTTEEAPAETPATEKLRGTEHILLVDDEAPILKLLKNTLEKLGYRVTACSSGVAALSAFNANPENFDMMISDMAMPQMTGVELARQIQAVRSDLPIIICTGYSERIDARRAADLGIRRLLIKPIDRSKLVDTIRRTLDGPSHGTDGSSPSQG